MIRLHLSAQTLAATRLAVSPLMEATAALVLVPQAGRVKDPQVGAIYEVLVRRRLELLVGIVDAPRGSWVPDMLNPEPAGYDPDLDAELHQVATTPTDRIKREIMVMINGLPRHGLSGRAIPPVAREVLDREGERGLAQRFANELEQFWHHYLADRWPTVMRALESDIAQRAQMAARGGLGSLLGSLNPTLIWNGHSLTTRSRHDIDSNWDQALLLIPSTLARELVIDVDPCGERSSYVVYPVPSAHADEDRDQSKSLGRLLGHTRLELMTSLAAPHTTTQLAKRHRLSASTVSYHIARLHQAGLLSKIRQGNRVYYQLTSAPRLER